MGFALDDDPSWLLPSAGYYHCTGYKGKCAEPYVREEILELDFVLSNAEWANGELTPEFGQPFDMIAVAIADSEKLNVTGVSSDDIHQLMYAESNALRKHSLVPMFS